MLTVACKIYILVAFNIAIHVYPLDISIHIFLNEIFLYCQKQMNHFKGYYFRLIGTCLLRQ